MATSVRMYRGYFRNLDQNWIVILPAASTSSFYDLYQSNNYRIDNVEYLNFHAVNIDFNLEDIFFYIPSLNIQFNSESQGYNFLYSYFSIQIREIEKARQEAYKDMYGEY
jgi:hypothetical protein